MDRSKIITGIGVLIAVIGLGLGIGWLATRPGKLPPPPTPEPSVASPTIKTIESNAPVVSRPAVPRPRVPSPVIRPTPEQVAAIAPTGDTATTWEDRLDEILASEDEDTNKVQQLLILFPSLPPDGQDEVAQHLSNLVEDEDYAPLGQLLLDPKLPEEVLDTLLADLLNRPNETKLPMFLEVAFIPNHPKAEEARDLLELYLDEDYGTDRATWQKKMEEWLKENPD